MWKVVAAAAAGETVLVSLALRHCSQLFISYELSYCYDDDYTEERTMRALTSKQFSDFTVGCFHIYTLIYIQIEISHLCQRVSRTSSRRKRSCGVFSRESRRQLNETLYLLSSQRFGLRYLGRRRGKEKRRDETRNQFFGTRVCVERSSSSLTLRLQSAVSQCVARLTVYDQIITNL
jgi:hypothetical protein